MRSSPAVALCLLSACAASGGSASQWRVIQQERLERLHQPLRPEAALATILRQEPQPGAAAQDPRHIDQQEPPRSGVGARPFRSAPHPFTVTADVGIGNVSARIHGTRLDDRADATFAKVAIDAASGAALHAEIWSSDKELFAGRRINDGIAPANADAGLVGVQVFPHLRFDPWRDGALRMPVRLGLFVDWQQLDHDEARVEREWLSLGPKLQLEPTWRMFGRDHAALDLFGRLGGEVGPAWFTEEYRGGDDRDVTARWSGELGAGLRGYFGRWQGELGYQLHHTTFDSIDSDLYGNRSRTELQRQQIFVGLGVWF